MVNQGASLKLDLQLGSKQLARKTLKVEESEKQIAILKDAVKNLNIQCEELKEIIRKRIPDSQELLAQPILMQANPTFASQANVVKPMRGGGGTILV